MKKITVLIKPVSSSCNMECDYCFYKDVATQRSHTACRMSNQTIETIIDKMISIQDSVMRIEFCFQGGEPLLAGIEFYHNFILAVEKRNKIHHIFFSMQTNGLLINSEWINLFKKNHFLIGISLDGTQAIHDQNRKIHGEGTYEKVINSITLLQDNKVDFNVLSVITSEMSTYAKEIYSLYKSHNYQYVQFIPCLPLFNGLGGLKPKEFSRFYKDLFDEFVQDRCIHIDFFEQIMQLKNGVKECSCGMLGYCSFQMIIEANGDVFPCDFYAIDKYCLGNINEIEINSPKTYQKINMFLKEDKNFSDLCDSCQYFNICQGYCKRQNMCLFDDNYCGYQDLLMHMDTYTKSR